MTKLLVTGQADLWNVFWMLAFWSASYMVAAVVLREIFTKPETLFEKYCLWFGRVVGVVGASIIFAYGYRTTSELERVEHQVEHWKALAAAKANGVSEHDQVSEMAVDTGDAVVSWTIRDATHTSVSVGSGEPTGGIRPVQRSVWGQPECEGTSIQCRFSRPTVGGTTVSELPGTECEHQRF
jgi:hypothetical protein